MPISVLETIDDCRTLASDWNEFATSGEKDWLDRDLTATFEWASALWQTRPEARRLKVLVLERSGRIDGILPLITSERRDLALRVMTLAPITQLNGGRSGFLLRTHTPDGIAEFFDFLHTKVADWDIFLFNLVDGSSSAGLLDRLLERDDYVCRVVSTEVSPYIRLPPGWGEYFGALPKKFRWTIRSSRRRLEERGHLEYRQISRPDQVGGFLDAIWEIERSSWKEAAGTSITTNAVQRDFYESLAPIAAERGWLSGHLIELDGEPLAYILGMEHRGIFQDLKESFKTGYQDMSPGHVLKSCALPALIESGVRIYDFMGRCEDYKMRWTNCTYGNTTYVLYNRTRKARLLQIKSRLGAIRSVDPRGRSSA